jgi:Holliday junction DNA helicase RuvA
MIGKITGTLTDIIGQEGLIETSGGVSYRVFLPASFFSYVLPAPVSVYTYLHVREDALVLYGFVSRAHLDLFSLLHSVSGVGPKTAFNTLSFTDPQGLEQAVKSNNLEYFTRIPGLGKKTAMKMLLELSTKMKKDFSLESLNLSEDDEMVVSALKSLGFTAKDIRSILGKIDKTAPLESRITQGIQLLTK